MQPRNFPRIIAILLGLGFALMGAINLWIFFIGDFTQGRAAIAVAGAILLFLACSFFAFPFSRTLFRIFGSIALLIFAGAMLSLVFQTGALSTSKPIHQIAAIAFAALVVARIALVFRPKRHKAGT